MLLKFLMRLIRQQKMPIQPRMQQKKVQKFIKKLPDYLKRKMERRLNCLHLPRVILKVLINQLENNPIQVGQERIYGLI